MRKGEKIKKKIKESIAHSNFQVENRHFQILTMLYSTEQANSRTWAIMHQTD